VHEGSFCIVKTQSQQHHRHVRCKQDVLMNMMTFVSSVSNHVYVGLHLLEQMCRLRLVSD
jgi:hypothetical protein